MSFKVNQVAAWVIIGLASAAAVVGVLEVKNSTGSQLTAIVSSPTASLTINGQTRVQTSVGSVVPYAWSSANATTFTSNYTADAPDCTGGVGAPPNQIKPWVAFTSSGSANATIQPCQAGRVYTINYLAGNGSVTSTAALTLLVSPQLTSVQGYNATTRVYTPNTAQQGTYLVLYGNPTGSLSGSFSPTQDTVVLDSVVVPAYAITYVSASQITISLSPPSGLNLAPGTNNHSVYVTTPAGSTAAVKFSITSAPSPAIALAPTNLSFSALSGTSAPTPQTLTVSDPTPGTMLKWKATTNQNWCYVNGASNAGSITGSTAYGSPTNISVSVGAPSNIGVFTCTVTVSDNGSSPPSTNVSQTAAVTYTVTAPVLTAVSISPSTATGFGPQALTATFSDTAGGGNISDAEMIILSNTYGWPIYAGTCSIDYNPGSKVFSIINDAGNAWMPIASNSSLSNSQCTVSTVGASASISGNTLSINNLNVTFNSSWGGSKNIWMGAGNLTGQSTSWVAKGTWTATSYLPPSVFIDLPVAHANITGNTAIAGWAIDNSTKPETAISELDIYVDGNLIASSNPSSPKYVAGVYGGSRPDVCAVYPGRLGCPNVGYNFLWNSSTVAPGAHTISVKAIDSDPAAYGGAHSTTATQTVNVVAPATFPMTVTVTGSSPLSFNYQPQPTSPTSPAIYSSKPGTTFVAAALTTGGSINGENRWWIIRSAKGGPSLYAWAGGTNIASLGSPTVSPQDPMFYAGAINAINPATANAQTYITVGQQQGLRITEYTNADGGPFVSLQDPYTAQLVASFNEEYSTPISGSTLNGQPGNCTTTAGAVLSLRPDGTVNGITKNYQIYYSPLYPSLSTAKLTVDGVTYTSLQIDTMMQDNLSSVVYSILNKVPGAPQGTVVAESPNGAPNSVTISYDPTLTHSYLAGTDINWKSSDGPAENVIFSGTSITNQFSELPDLGIQSSGLQDFFEWLLVHELGHGLGFDHNPASPIMSMLTQLSLLNQITSPPTLTTVLSDKTGMATVFQQLAAGNVPVTGCMPSDEVKTNLSQAPVDDVLVRCGGPGQPVCQNDPNFPGDDNPSGGGTIPPGTKCSADELADGWYNTPDGGCAQVLPSADGQICSLDGAPGVPACNTNSASCKDNNGVVTSCEPASPGGWGSSEYGGGTNPGECNLSGNNNVDDEQVCSNQDDVY